MQKEEIKAKLEKAGIEYDGRWGIDKLEALLPTQPEKTEEEIKNIEKSITKIGQKPPDMILEELTTRPDGERQTKNGILVPSQVTTGIKRTKWEWFGDEYPSKTVVIKISPQGYQEEVRTYDEPGQGPNFRELARGFIDKRNRLGK